MQRFPDILADVHGGQVLDMATGGGGFIKVLTGHLAGFESVIGVDAHANGARTGDPFDGRSISFREMDAHALDFPDDTFDTVSIFNGLHHMRDPVAVLREGLRVLKPGGRIILGEMTADGQTERKLTQILIHDWRGEIDRATGVAHRGTYSRSQVTELAEAAGVRDPLVIDYPRGGKPVEGKELDHPRGMVSGYLPKAANLPGGAELVARGEELLRRIETVGFETSDAIVIMGTK